MHKKKCSRCKKILAWPENFNKDSWKKEGHRSECKECQYKDRYEWGRKNSHIVKAQKKRKVLRKQTFIMEYLTKHPCADCGLTDIRVLEFDHIGNEKNANISELIKNGSLTKIQKEISLCEVVCANCHRIRTMARGNHFRHSYLNNGM